MDTEITTPYAVKRPFPRWKKVLIGFAAALVGAGVVLEVSGDHGAPRGEAARGGDPAVPGPHGLVEGPAPGPRREPRPPEEPSLSRRLSPFLLPAGLSFFAGLAVGAALRALFRWVVILVGAALLLVFVLTYTGVIGPIDWEGIERWLGGRIAQAQGHAAGFRDHILYSLPSAGMAGAGLMTGLRRR